MGTGGSATDGVLFDSKFPEVSEFFAGDVGGFRQREVLPLEILRRLAAHDFTKVDDTAGNWLACTRRQRPGDEASCERSAPNSALTQRARNQRT